MPLYLTLKGRSGMFFYFFVEVEFCCLCCFQNSEILWWWLVNLSSHLVRVRDLVGNIAIHHSACINYIYICILYLHGHLSIKLVLLCWSAVQLTWYRNTTNWFYFAGNQTFGCWNVQVLLKWYVLMDIAVHIGGKLQYLACIWVDDFRRSLTREKKR